MNSTAFEPYTVPIKVDDGLRSRFWAKVDKQDPDECWEWTACRNTRGYGRIVLTATKTLVLAPRVSWTLANGPIPAGMIVCHSCDNPPCVNPAHLFLGTHKDNYDDMVAKGRATEGVDHRALKLYCKRGHRLAGDNIGFNENDDRYCKTCKKLVGTINRHKANPGIRPYAERTHCPQGHEYTPENTGRYRNRRHCKTCKRASWKKQDQARKLARLATR